MNVNEKSLSVVVPCHNEQETLEYSHNRIMQALREIPVKHVEIIYVNDGSTDRTGDILEGFHRQSVQERGLRSGGSSLGVSVVELSRNFGHSSAVLAGLAEADTDLTAIMDADLQDPPEIIGKMIERMSNGAEVVYGVRQRRERETIWKKTTAWFFYRILNLLTGFSIPKDTGDFRVFTKRVREALLRCRETDPFIRGLVAWVGFRQEGYFYIREPRKFGETRYPLSKMIRFASLAILSFSSKPLLIGLYVGAGGLFITLLLIAWAIWAFFMGITIPGWASTMGAFLGGQSFILMLLGIIGAYVSRVYIEVQGRPRYIVRRELRSHRPSDNS